MKKTLNLVKKCNEAPKRAPSLLPGQPGSSAPERQDAKEA